MRMIRLLLIGFGVGAAVAFAVSLLRNQRLAQVTGYYAPTAADGPSVVPDQLDLTVHAAALNN